MFDAWGRWVFRHRGTVLAVAAVLMACAVLTLLRGAHFSTGTVRGTESDRAARLLAREMPQGTGASFRLVFAHPTLDTADPRFAAAVARAIAPLRQSPHVREVETPWDTPPVRAAQLLGTDHHHALVFVRLHDIVVTATGYYPALRASVVAPQGFEVTAAGLLPLKADVDRTLEADLRRAELLSAPIALLVLLLVFDSLVAALLPLIVGGLAVACGLAAVFLLARVTDVAQYALNVTSLIGLGVAIDYSLFVVKRHREERARGADPEHAVGLAVAGAGRAVAFSGLAVAAGLAGLLVFHGSYLESMGIAGAIVVAFAVLFALTVLPALLALLGPRVDALKVPWPWKRTARARAAVAAPGSTGPWHRLAMAVMRRPLAVLLPTLAVLFTLASPFLRLQFAAADERVLPPRAESHRGADLLRQYFPDMASEPFVLVARFADAPALRSDRLAALAALEQHFATLPGVRRVDGPGTALAQMQRQMAAARLAGAQAAAAAAAAAHMTPEQAAAAARARGRSPSEPSAAPGAMPDLAALPPAAAAGLARAAGPHVLVAEVTPVPGLIGEARRTLLDALRAQRHVADGELLVTGVPAVDEDISVFIRHRAPWAVLAVALVTALVLLALLDSVVLPVKAVLMNALSLSGSFGAMVWIFQEGHLRHILGDFTPTPLDPSLPVLLFCAVFGLSMDYEVLLLSRMKEEYRRTGDDRAAVAVGLERSGALITSAAAIMVAVFAAFATAEVMLIKAIGLGMAIAVALDATLVRVLVVPATMRLLGALNWWTPWHRGRMHRASDSMPPGPPLVAPDAAE